jgi:predicted small secreted protein
MKVTLNVMGIVMLAMVATGCSTMHQQGTGADVKEYMPPTSIYNILDSTALVYSDPAAGSAVNDHPLRWLGFVAHPIGHAFDYGINRPMYTLASGFAYLSGYTAEDTMVNAQRR